MAERKRNHDNCHLHIYSSIYIFRAMSSSFGGKSFAEAIFSSRNLRATSTRLICSNKNAYEIRVFHNNYDNENKISICVCLYLNRSQYYSAIDYYYYYYQISFSKLSINIIVLKQVVPSRLYLPRVKYGT